MVASEKWILAIPTYTSSSDNWLWKVSKVGFTLIVYTICQNNAYRNQLFFNGLPSKSNPTLNLTVSPKRFKCEAILQANWDQQISPNLSYLKPESKTRVFCKTYCTNEY